MGRRGDRRPGELVRAQRRPRAVLRRMDPHRPAARARRAMGGAVGSGQSLGVRRLPSRPARRAANHDLYGVGCPAHLGISPIDKFIKDGGQFVYTVPARLDGDGTFAQVRLPMGVTADMVADRRDRLAANLGTPSLQPDQHQHPRGRHKQHPKNTTKTPKTRLHVPHRGIPPHQETGPPDARHLAQRHQPPHRLRVARTVVCPPAVTATRPAVTKLVTKPAARPRRRHHRHAHRPRRRRAGLMSTRSSGMTR
jgi:hypothetical protein